MNLRNHYAHVLLHRSFQVLQQTADADKCMWLRALADWQSKEGSLRERLETKQVELQTLVARRTDLTQMLTRQTAVHAAEATAAAAELAAIRDRISKSEIDTEALQQDLVRTQHARDMATQAHGCRASQLQQQLASAASEVARCSALALQEQEHLRESHCGHQRTKLSWQRQCSELEAALAQQEREHSAQTAQRVSGNDELREKVDRVLDDTLKDSDSVHDQIVTLRAQIMRWQSDVDVYKQQCHALNVQIILAKQTNREACEAIAAQYDTATAHHDALTSAQAHALQQEHARLVGRLTTDLNVAQAAVASLQGDLQLSQQQSHAHENVLRDALAAKEIQLTAAREQYASAVTQLAKLQSLLRAQLGVSQSNPATSAAPPAPPARSKAVPIHPGNHPRARVSPAPVAGGAVAATTPTTVAAPSRVGTYCGSVSPTALDQRAVSFAAASLTILPTTPTTHAQLSVASAPTNGEPSFEDKILGMSLEESVNLVRQQFDRLKSAPSVPDKLGVVWFQPIATVATHVHWQSDDQVTDCTICQTSFGCV